MISKMSQSGHTAYGMLELVLDTIEDVKDLPTDGVHAGSTAFVISTGDVYMANSVGEWVKI